MSTLPRLPPDAAIPAASAPAPVALELRPSGGAPGSGSQISLAAMRLLGIALTALAEVTVYGPSA